MGHELTTPRTLLEVVRIFADEQVAFEAMRDRRWAHGVRCPLCDHDKVTFTATTQTKPGKQFGTKTTVRRLWRCNGCRKQFTVKTGTIFEDSPIPLSKWLPAMWLIGNAKNGISSCEVARSLGVTQKTAWFMLHRIRHAMHTGTFLKLSGDVEADETLIGGLGKNMHKDRKAALKKAAGTDKQKMALEGKTMVLGMIERGGKAVTMVIPDRSQSILNTQLRRHIKPGANVFTDEWRAYRSMRFGFNHYIIDHSQAYVDGIIHTNGMENYWSLLKRTIRGTYISVDAFHLNRYLDEQAFRFNGREGKDGDRFESLVPMAVGRRLTYNQLTGKVAAN